MGNVDKPLSDTNDLAHLYEDSCAKVPRETRIVIQASQKLQAFRKLFYIKRTLGCGFELLSGG